MAPEKSQREPLSHRQSVGAGLAWAAGMAINEAIEA
jgi:hypothetical protein